MKNFSQSSIIYISKKQGNSAVPLLIYKEICMHTKSLDLIIRKNRITKKESKEYVKLCIKLKLD
jgi:hypothetical protein